jgi:hypothetical protein
MVLLGLAMLWLVDLAGSRTVDSAATLEWEVGDVSQLHAVLLVLASMRAQQRSTEAAAAWAK